MTAVSLQLLVFGRLDVHDEAVITASSQADGSLLLFRYRHWKLGEDIDLIVRCEHDGVMTGANGEVSFINVKTLNEWDSRVRGSHYVTASPKIQCLLFCFF